jgi:hypothetical protein
MAVSEFLLLGTRSTSRRGFAVFAAFNIGSEFLVVSAFVMSMEDTDLPLSCLSSDFTESFSVNALVS